MRDDTNKIDSDYYMSCFQRRIPIPTPVVGAADLTYSVFARGIVKPLVLTRYQRDNNWRPRPYLCRVVYRTNGFG
jgi:hypothetical protein